MALGDSFITPYERATAQTIPAADHNDVAGNTIYLRRTKRNATNSEKSADYTVTDTDEIGTLMVTCSTSTIVITLPTAADNNGRIIEVTKIDHGTGKVRIVPEGSEKINGLTEVFIVARYAVIRLQSDGTEWAASLMQTYREYLTGTTYNSVALSVTSGTGGVSWTTARGTWVPYQTIQGDVRIRFNENGTMGASSTALILIVNGIQFKNVGNYLQAVGTQAGANAFMRCYAQPGQPNLVISWNTGAAYTCGISSDVELESWPTWAD